MTLLQSLRMSLLFSPRNVLSYGVTSLHRSAVFDRCGWVCLTSNRYYFKSALADQHVFSQCGFTACQSPNPFNPSVPPIPLSGLCDGAETRINPYHIPPSTQLSGGRYMMKRVKDSSCGNVFIGTHSVVGAFGTHNTLGAYKHFCRHLFISSCVHSKVDTSAEILTETDVNQLAGTVITEASKLDVMVKSVPKTKVEQLIIDLHNCGFQTADIQALLAGHPRYITSKKLASTVDTFLQHGLQLGQILLILQNFEAVLDVSDKRISEVFNALQDARVYSKHVPSVISRNPLVLLQSKKDIALRVGALRQLFTTADAVTLVKQCPEVLTDSWPENEAKFTYIFSEMKVTQKQMVYASVFRHSLQHIKQRHMFLLRAGLFDMSKRREGEKSPNARLDEIIDSTDEVFCRKFGGFRVEEYKTFCKMFDKEVKDMDSDDENF